MRSTLAAALALGVATTSCVSIRAEDAYRQDFAQAVREIGATYAYFDAKATRWNEIPALYAADLDRVSTREQFIALLERVVDELYDPHAQLNVNLPRSPRLVPSGTDLWAEWRAGAAVVTQVRADSDAARAGIEPNATVLAIDGMPIADAAEARLGRAYVHEVGGARDWALRAVLAGRHDTARTLVLEHGGVRRSVELPAPDQFARPAAALAVSEIEPGIGYIRFNDSLGDIETVVAFDRALAQLRDTRALVVDLRDTPSGGNTSVARGVLGRFVRSDLPYQKHRLPAEERETGVRRSWLELVSPRGDFVYARPVAVLVNRWTGSMGEGLAIGFDATRAGIVIGTPMASLLGATEHLVLARTGIGINVPTERLFHVDGTPREQFRPAVTVDPADTSSGKDPFIAAALRVLASP